MEVYWGSLQVHILKIIDAFLGQYKIHKHHIQIFDLLFVFLECSLSIT